MRILVGLADEVVLLARNTGQHPEIEALGVRVVDFDYQRKDMNPLRSAANVAKLTAILRKERPDVVHLIAMKPIVIGGLAARLARVPATVVHMTGLGYLVTSETARVRNVRQLVLKHIAQVINKPGNWLLCENPDDLAFLKANGARPDARVTVLGGAGIDEAAFQPLPPPSNEVPVAGYAGRMLHSKGVDTLVEASRILAQRAVPLNVALYGRLDEDNPEAITAQEIAEWTAGDAAGQAASGRIAWHGHVDDLRQVWESCDIFVLAAKMREGMPRAMLEAAAFARPLIVTDIPGCRHFVREGIEGRIVQPDDPGALADAIEALAKNPALRHRMGQAARERLLDGFTENQVTQAIGQAYVKLAEQRPAAKAPPASSGLAPTSREAATSPEAGSAFTQSQSLKRALDIVAATGGLVAASPILLAVGALIRLESPGPAIFAQARVGRDGREFTCYKLRTMRAETDNVPTHMVGASSITRIGGFLRKSKLDEVPQLVNVLRGEMSLVGPRPCLPSQDQLIAERRGRGVLDVRPGITGLAQINDIDMSDPVRLARVDAHYVRRQRLALDLRIVWRTVAGRGMAVDRVRTGASNTPAHSPSAKQS